MTCASRCRSLVPQVGYGERKGQQPRALDVAAPIGTMVAGGAKHAPVAAFLAQQNNDNRRAGGVHPGRATNEPMSTVTQLGSHQTPVAAFIARQFGASTGHAADTPLGTVTAGGQGKSQLVAAWMGKWYGTDQDPRLDAPMHTVTTKDRFGVEVAQLAAPPFAPEHHARARAVAEFLRNHDAWHGSEFVTLTIEDASYIVIDIGMRMLTPRELFRAQGFPADYVIEGVWEGLETPDPVWVPFAKDVQVSCCGISVCPPLAEALVAANCGHLRVGQWGGAAAEIQEG
mgnify:CR=1 FL=1